MYVITNLYFAIAPSGMMKACCDYELDKDFYVYDEKFVTNYKIEEFMRKYIRKLDHVKDVYMGVILSHYYL